MRIVAGKHRGLNLNTFDAENIRPTTDRVRENVFNKIQFGISGSRVLDLFAGTGAVSLEFISRGAEKVISVDNNENSQKLIESNFKKANEKLNLIKKDYKSALQLLRGDNFDFIFLDPPYNTDFAEGAISIISSNSMLNDDGIIIYEHLLGKEFKLPKNFEIFDFKKYGTIAVTFIREKSND